MLEVKDLSVYYGKARAVEGVSLKVDEGEVVSLVGANGAGKTTILRTISGLKKPTSGEIRFQGKRVDGMPAHKVVEIGIVQIPSGRMIFAPMTVLDNLKIGALLRRDKHNIPRDLETMYEHFPILKERRMQLAGQLSGGQQQMLAIARGLMAGPKLLLMDEPSIGLSPLLVAEVGKIIKKINQEGLSILLVEQNARVALKLSERAYILEVGSIVMEGKSEELIDTERVKKAYLGGV